MKYIKYLLMACMVLGSYSVFGQQKRTTLSDEEQNAITQGIKELVNQFNDRLTEIWRRPTDSEKLDMKKFDRKKKFYVKETLAMFVNNGEDWYSYDTIGGRVDSTLIRNAARMETTSKWRSKPYSQPVKTYLAKASTSSYDSVVVTTGDAWYCSNLKKISDDIYEATLSYTQSFKAYNGEGRLVYGDRVTKTIKAYAFRVVVIDDVVWRLSLGDIKAVEWERAKKNKK